MVARVTVPVSRRDVLKLGGAAAAAVGTFGFRPRQSLADGDPPPLNVKQPDRGGTFRIYVGIADGDHVASTSRSVRVRVHR